MRSGRRLRWDAVAWVMALVAWRAAEARVKLTTLPVRERVEIQLDNGKATLVEEERIVTLLKGTNHVDFSWSNTRIDKDTILFRVVDMPTRRKRDDDPPAMVRPDGRVEMIRVVFVACPPSENARLHDYQTLEFTYDVKPNHTLPWHCQCTHHLGTRARQDRLRLNGEGR